MFRLRNHAIRLVAADLQPVAHGLLVGAAEEPEVVDVEARRLEADVRVEANALAADLADSRSAPALPLSEVRVGSSSNDVASGRWK